MGKANIARFSKGPLENVDVGSHDFKVSMLVERVRDGGSSRPRAAPANYPISQARCSLLIDKNRESSTTHGHSLYSINVRQRPRNFRPAGSPVSWFRPDAITLANLPHPLTRWNNHILYSALRIEMEKMTYHPRWKIQGGLVFEEDAALCANILQPSRSYGPP
jgi:hypothetical protein